MATGKFRLFYKDGHVEHPCVGVHYQVVSSTHAIAASGLTDAQGETALFRSLGDGGRYRLLVRQTAAGGYAEPDAVEEREYKPELELGAAQDGRHALQRVRIKPYFRVRFHTHPDGKPVVGAKFTAYTLDAHGKEAIARDLVKASNVSGKTDAKGETEVIYCASNVVFKFEVPGAGIKVPTRRLQPLIKGQDTTIYDLPFKTVRATTGPAQNHEALLSGKTSAPILISPSDQELIMVPQGDFDEFEEMSGRLEKIMEAAHLAKLDLSRALESQNEQEISAAEKALGLAEDKVKSELNKNFSKLADLKEVVTLETYNKGKNSATGASQMGLRRRYLKTDKYLELKNKRLNKAEYKLNIKFSGPAGTKASAGVNTKALDVNALKESFQKISKSLKSSKEWKTDPQVLNMLDLAGNEYADNIIKSETYEVEAQAQWLRLVGGAGASAEVDWTKRKAQIQGNLQGKAVLCEGKMTGRWAVPSLKGWMMSFGGEDLGAVRFIVECELYGFAGAKVVASGAVGISLEGGKQVAKAIKRDRSEALAKLIDPKTKLPRFEADGPYAKAPENLNGVQADLDAFAGVEAGLTPGGKIQWLPPQEKDFVSFAEVSATLAVSAGAGAGAQLSIYLAGGKFRIKASARLCWGVGAKGALEFTVNADKVAEFVRWLYYQLLHAGFRTLVYVEHQAFRALSQLLLMLVAEGTPSHKYIEQVSQNVNESFIQFEQSLELAQKRKAMVDNINRVPHWLVHATPETRGMLLYQITRHGMPSHMRDAPSVGEGSLFDPQVHYLPTHKQAVLNIMGTVQTRSEWDNVMQHMTSNGQKSPRSAGQNEGDVLRFLNNGVSLAELPSVFEALNEAGPVMKPVGDKKDTGNAYLDKYLKMRGKLLGKFPKGYRVARLDSAGFEMYAVLDGARSLQFAQIQTAGLGQAMAGDPGSSVA